MDDALTRRARLDPGGHVPWAGRCGQPEASTGRGKLLLCGRSLPAPLEHSMQDCIVHSANAARVPPASSRIQRHPPMSSDGTAGDRWCRRLHARGVFRRRYTRGFTRLGGLRVLACTRHAYRGRLLRWASRRLRGYADPRVSHSRVPVELEGGTRAQVWSN